MARQTAAGRTHHARDNTHDARLEHLYEHYFLLPMPLSTTAMRATYYSLIDYYYY